MAKPPTSPRPPDTSGQPNKVSELLEMASGGSSSTTSVEDGHFHRNTSKAAPNGAGKHAKAAESLDLLAIDMHLS